MLITSVLDVMLAQALDADVAEVAQGEQGKEHGRRQGFQGDILQLVNVTEGVSNNL